MHVILKSHFQYFCPLPCKWDTNYFLLKRIHLNRGVLPTFFMRSDIWIYGISNWLIHRARFCRHDTFPFQLELVFFLWENQSNLWIIWQPRSRQFHSFCIGTTSPSFIRRAPRMVIMVPAQNSLQPPANRGANQQPYAQVFPLTVYCCVHALCSWNSPHTLFSWQYCIAGWNLSYSHNTSWKCLRVSITSDIPLGCTAPWTRLFLTSMWK